MKKILFNDKFNLTEAVLSGRKTMTRRIIPKTLLNVCDLTENPIEFHDANFDWYDITKSTYAFQVGEIVAIAQSYKDAGYSQYALNRAPKTMEIRGHMGESAGWNNKMFVRAEACKNRIRITNVRVERLQDISWDDCLKEGIYADEDPMNPQAEIFTFPNAPQWWFSPKEAYAALIDKVSGKGTWESNPYVFAYEFELVK